MKKLVLLALLMVIILPISAVDTETIFENVDSVKEDKPVKVIINSELMHITQIDFTANKDIGDIQLKIANLKNRPSTSAVPDADVYEYFEIVPYGFEDADLKSIDITFFIIKNWLSYRNHDKSDVVLLRYAGGDWEELETEFIDEVSSLYNFKAKTPGFQFFAIAAVEKAAEEEPIAMITTGSVDEPKEETTSLETANYLLAAIAFGLVVLILIGSYAFLKKIKKQRRVRPRKRKKRAKRR